MKFMINSGCKVFLSATREGEIIEGQRIDQFNKQYILDIPSTDEGLWKPAITGVDGTILFYFDGYLNPSEKVIFNLFDEGVGVE